MNKSNTPLFFALYCVLFMVAFNYTLSIMASPYIVGDLGGSNDITTYSVSFFALGNAMSIPLSRMLIQRIGLVSFLLLCLDLFALFSLTTCISPNYPFFNASRLMQGFVSGPLYVLIIRTVSEMVPREKENKFIGINLTIITIAPVIGAAWGGWLAYAWSWRAVFVFNIPLKLFLAWFLWKRLKGYPFTPVKKEPFDGMGYLSYLISAFCIGLIVIMGQELDWFRSDFVIALAIIGSVFLLYYLLREKYHPHPLMDLRMLKKPVFSFALFNLAVLFSAYFGMIVLLALWLTLWVKYTPYWVGVIIGTMAISGIFPMLLVSERCQKIDCRIFLAIAITFLALSCFHTMQFNVDINFGRIAFSRVLAGFGLAFFLVPIFRLCVRSFPRDMRTQVLTLYQVVRALSSGLGASIYATIWLRRQVFFHERLGSKLTVFSQETQQFFSNAEQVQLSGIFADAQLEYYLQREATSLALDDCFYLMGLVLVGLLLTFAFTFLLHKDAFYPEKSPL